jgi:hypothetical protein
MGLGAKRLAVVDSLLDRAQRAMLRRASVTGVLEFRKSNPAMAGMAFGIRTLHGRSLKKFDPVYLEANRYAQSDR